MTEHGETVIGEGMIKFGLDYRDAMSDQGLCVHVLGHVDGEEIELLRFDHQPHYHYGPQKLDESLMLDKTTEGDALEWALKQIGERLPEMVRRAGYDELAAQIDMDALGPTLAELEGSARRMAREGRNTVVHSRGDLVVDAGPIRIGLEFRELSGDRGVAMHVLGDVGGEEVEMLAFDCFENEPHYHYGPRAKNQRLHMDTTAVPDPLRWALDLFKGGKLASMLERAGYNDHASGLNPAVMAEKVAEVESAALKMRAAHAR